MWGAHSRASRCTDRRGVVIEKPWGWYTLSVPLDSPTYSSEESPGRMEQAVTQLF